MGIWNYRLVRRKIGKETFYGVHEAYYDAKGRVWAITENPSNVFGDDKEEVLRILTSMLQDVLKRPILDYDKVPEKGAVNPGGPVKKKRRKK